MRVFKQLLAASILVTLARPSIAMADDPAPPASAPAASAPFAAPAAYFEAVPPPRVRRSTGAFVGGIVVTALGGAAAVIGTGALLSHDNGHGACVSANETVASVGIAPIDCTNNSSKAPAYGLIIGGAAAALIGIPLAIYGGQKVPVATARLTVAPTAGGASAGLTLRF